jgi:hypothetical protein
MCIKSRTKFKSFRMIMIQNKGNCNKINLQFTDISSCVLYLLFVQRQSHKKGTNLFFFNILLVFHLFHFFTMTIGINQPHIYAGGLGLHRRKSFEKQTMWFVSTGGSHLRSKQCDLSPQEEVIWEVNNVICLHRRKSFEK